MIYLLSAMFFLSHLVVILVLYDVKPR
jgi:hypothetical protein